MKHFVLLTGECFLYVLCVGISNLWIYFRIFTVTSYDQKTRLINEYFLLLFFFFKSHLKRTPKDLNFCAESKLWLPLYLVWQHLWEIICFFHFEKILSYLYLLPICARNFPKCKMVTFLAPSTFTRPTRSMQVTFDF